MGRIVTLPPGGGPRRDGTVVGGWWHTEGDGQRITCDLCPRQCSLKPDARGFCFVRQNLNGQMVLTTYGRSTGFCVDPIEKKPLNHFLPGTAVLSFGTAGCNLGCKFCQNWDISKSREVERASEFAVPETIARAAGQLGCHSVAFTYNDPIIWAEYAIDTAKACHRHGIKTVAVTAGYIEPAARGAFFQEIDAANVDLKALSEDFYTDLAHARLQPILDTLSWLKRETDIWFEITNLVIPRANDSQEDLRRLCDWITKHVGDEVPVHFTAFHPAFKMADRPPTPHETLLAAHDIAKQQGINFVYVGNIHDPEHDSTYCPFCSMLLIERNWHQLGVYRLQGNRCPQCNGLIAGCFESSPGTWGARRLPVRIADFGPASACSTDSACRKPIDKTIESAVHSTSDPLPLTEQQSSQIHRAACEIVTAGVRQRPVNLSDPKLAGAADKTVMGVFVTLKRRSHLRACCGTLGRPMPLMEALRSAAFRTATEDLRWPPISAVELPYLTLDVSLLTNFQAIAVGGTDRAGHVTVGRHGLTIQRDESGGLLLPSVPVENGWDVETFLRQLCRKAGLPSTAWMDDATTLQTFEAKVIQGPIDDCGRADDLPKNGPLVSMESLRKLAAHCQANIQALVTGATPNYYLLDCPDATVQGVAMTVTLTGRQGTLPLARLSMRPGLPLQATLFQMSEAAARWCAGQSLVVDAGNQIEVSIAVLHDSALHGTVTAPELDGIDSTRRSLIVMQQGRSGWVFDPGKTVEEQLQVAVKQTLVLDADTASIFSFATDTTCQTLTVTNVPRPQLGSPVRPPAVAGTFYPNSAAELDEMVETLLGQSKEKCGEFWPAVMVPHAGLRFSGRIAADVFKQVAIPDHVIILAPKHTRHGLPWAVAPHQSWSIPGHSVPSDPELAERLAEAVEGLVLDAAAHREEHAIEVQLPLLTRLAPNSRVVGIAIGGGDLKHCQKLADGLADVVGEMSTPPLLVISTDLNHYGSEEENQLLDHVAIDAIRQLNPAHLYKTVRSHSISMCGVLPAVIVLQTLKRLGGLHTYRQIGYTTSAEVTGNRERVVGYAGFLFQ